MFGKKKVSTKPCPQCDGAGGWYDMTEPGDRRKCLLCFGSGIASENVVERSSAVSKFLFGKCMLKCPVCNIEAPHDSKFCPKCGKALR